ncbi:MFS transporter [Stenotrophomonas sp.]|uniref:MFS transporter n=1 Tax=Stenotrophomonas sp. TaxID=69392 RepID=UPI0019A89984|nr:MFS transporter [Stenotrophomonas sp.]MBD3826693.1 MFS transporter [Stenotrophomonas sp.]
MSTSYRALFSARGTRAFALAGLLARLPLPMTGIGIITLLSRTHGSYALAGAVSATFVLAYALLSPPISARVDRYGQARVLPAAAALSALGMLALVASTHWHAPDWSLFVWAALAGTMPSMSAMVRARWTAMFRGQPHLQTAYSLETVLDEVTFIGGPPVSVGLSVVAFPQAGLLLAALLLILGVFALVVQRSTEPPPSSDARSHGNGSVLGSSRVRLLTGLMVAMGVIVGTVDIASVALAAHLGRPAAASLALSTYAAGSCAAGLLFGTVAWRIPLHRLLLLGGIATAATTSPLLLLAGSIPALSAALLLAGAFFAPTMIVAMSLVERLVPAARLTEGMTWLLAGLNIGVAMGAAIAGQVVDGQGARAGFAVALAGGAAVLLLAGIAHHRLCATSVNTDAAA